MEDAAEDEDRGRCQRGEKTVAVAPRSFSLSPTNHSPLSNITIQSELIYRLQEPTNHTITVSC